MMRGKVTVFNLHKSYKINEPCARNMALSVLRMVGRNWKKSPTDLEIVFMDDRSIKGFNRRYRSENRATDVLSFMIDARSPGRKAFLAEVLISLDTARRNAGAYGTSLAEEAVLYVIHGILHLSGYDDRNGREGGRMRRKQEEILDRLCSCRDLSEVLTPR